MTCFNSGKIRWNGFPETNTRVGLIAYWIELPILLYRIQDVINLGRVGIR
jgi:hypothetical protein